MLDDTYAIEIRLTLRALGIPESYGADRGLPIYPEATDLVSVGTDIFGREQRLAPACANAWSTLREAAASDGIVVQLVSGFRSVEYQRGIIERKLAKGLHIQEILRSSAAPGHSEHHTGRAIDVTTPGTRPLEEEFEHTTAFAWLSRRAMEFGFRLSFPRGNPHGVVYEPWHWLHHPSV